MFFSGRPADPADILLRLMVEVVSRGLVCRRHEVISSILVDTVTDQKPGEVESEVILPALGRVVPNYQTRRRLKTSAPYNLFGGHFRRFNFGIVPDVGLVMLGVNRGRDKRLMPLAHSEL